MLPVSVASMLYFPDLIHIRRRMLFQDTVNRRTRSASA
jgi:hypothetical protein